MSLITRCPACRTMFKVVPDQLKISEGWVRCGKCEEIFDASAHMQEELAPVAAVSDAPAPKARKRRPEAALEAKVPEVTAASAEPAFAVDLVIEPGRTEPSLESLGEPLHVDAEPATIIEAREEEVEPAAVNLPAQPQAQAVPLSFMKTARPASRWHRPLVRAMLMVAALLLVLTLALQWLVQERDGIAVREPGLRPLIEEICLQFGCEVQPLRQIESVVIDSSAFSKVKGDLYRLSLTLKNNAPIDLALTDTLDHALIRRVLQPEELGARDGVIRAAGETQATLMLTIKTNGNGERIAGYRLLAFYP